MKKKYRIPSYLSKAQLPTYKAIMDCVGGTRTNEQKAINVAKNAAAIRRGVGGHIEASIVRYELKTLKLDPETICPDLSIKRPELPQAPEAETTAAKNLW